MKDADLRSLERAAKEQPNDLKARDALVKALRRDGRGWHGEDVPSGLTIDPEGERGLYLSCDARRGQLDCMEFVYVAGAETECDRCHHGAYAITTALSKPDDPKHTCLRCAGKGRVTIAPFYCAKYPVTWSEYLAFAEAKVRQTPPAPEWLADDNGALSREEAAWHPVIGVPRAEALLFCEWSGLRLLTSVEWEWAAYKYDPQERGDFKCPSCETLVVPYEHCSRCGGSGRIHPLLTRQRYPWGDDKLTPERTALVVKCSNEECVRGGTLGPDGEYVGGCGWCYGHGYERAGTTSAVVEILSITERKPARPLGASPFGVMDMWGNVAEHTRDGVCGESFRGDVGERREWVEIHRSTLTDEDARRIVEGSGVGFRVALSAV